MVLKRKRSDDDDAMSICSVNSSYSRDNSVSPFGNHQPVMMNMEMTDAMITHHYIPQGVHSRTLKRWRNNKPDETRVHEYTLSKLFSAQQQTSPLTPQIQISPSYTGGFTPINSPPHHHIQPIPTPPAAATQRSLLSFFSRQQSHPQQHATHNHHLLQAQTTSICCADCDSRIPTSFDDEEGECFACRSCGKKVCGTCSTGGEGWGDVRRCLECALH